MLVGEELRADVASGGGVTNATYVPAQTQSVLVDVVNQLAASGPGAIEVLSDQPLKVTPRAYNEVSSTASRYAGGVVVAKVVAWQQIG